jgi:hypothetical protein
LHNTGTTPEDNAIRQAAFKASKQELVKLQSQRGPVMSFARTAELNLQNALRLSDKVDRTGSPVVNRWLLAGRKSILGDKDVSNFDAAVRTGINEYAKVVSSATGGGVTSDTARKEIEAQLNSAMNPEQIKDMMKEVFIVDLNNRKSGYDEQIKFIKDSMAGKTEPNPVAPSGGEGARARAAWDYLSQHGKGYSDSSLRKSLTDAGYEKSEIDTAMRQYSTRKSAVNFIKAGTNKADMMKRAKALIQYNPHLTKSDIDAIGAEAGYR